MRSKRKLNISKSVYRDPLETTTRYHQAFYIFIQFLTPHVYEDLRRLTPLFDRLTSRRNRKKSFSRLLQLYKELEFDRLAMRMQLENAAIIEVGRDILFSDLKFQLMGVAALNAKTTLSYVPDEILERLHVIRNLIIPVSKKIERTWANSRSQYRSVVQSYVLLHCELMEWSEKYGIGSEMTIFLAYKLLDQFSRNPNVKIEDLDVYLIVASDLEGEQFEFHTDGWMASNESFESYRNRVIEQVNLRLDEYLSTTYVSLRLENVKKVSRPIDFARVRWLVRWTVQGWSKDEILAELEQEGRILEPKAIDEAFKVFRKFGLPVRD